MLPDRMEPMMRDQIEPLLRERLRNRPTRIRIGTPMRIRTLRPLLDPDGDSFDIYDDIEEPLDIYNDIEPVSPETIRDLVAITIRDARSALKQLAADRVA